MDNAISPIKAGIELRLKVIPGARSDSVAGLLGNRIKIRISAPPEAGKANKAVIRLLAKRLGVKPHAIEITAGHHAPEKTVCVTGIDVEHASRALDI